MGEGQEPEEVHSAVIRHRISYISQSKNDAGKDPMRSHSPRTISRSPRWSEGLETPPIARPRSLWPLGRILLLGVEAGGDPLKIPARPPSLATAAALAFLQGVEVSPCGGGLESEAGSSSPPSPRKDLRRETGAAFSFR